MSTKASQDRYVVMDAYVNIMKGNLKQLEVVHNKLVEVLSIVIFNFILEVRIPSSFVSNGNGQVHDGKRN